MNKIIQGDCLEVMATIGSNCISCIVTDPPYGLGLMGRKWDASSPSKEIWEQALRVSKVGAWALVFGGTRTHHRVTCAIEDAGWEIKDCLMWLYGSGFPKGKGCFKPAYEPIILARKKGPKPELNIDECRVGTDSIEKGRWPTNVIFDEEATKMLDEQSGIEASRFFYCAKASPREKNEGLEAFPDKIGGGMNSTVSGDTRTGHITMQKNTHPTVKPVKLMEYLIKLVMPIDGVLLDPFAGSGTTILAAKRLGFNAIGIEKCEEYCEIARARIA